MSSITKSTGATLVSMLGTVKITADTAARAVHTVASSLDMLDQYVQDARASQIAHSAINRITMLDNLQTESALEAAKSQAAIQRELNADNVLAELFTKNFAKFGEHRLLIQTKLDALDNRVIIG